MNRNQLTIKKALAAAIKLCWKEGYNANNKYDPLHFWQISDDLKEVEKIIYPVNYSPEKKQQDYLGEEKVKEYFAKHLCSHNWQIENKKTPAGKLVYHLNRAGTTCLEALNADPRVRKIPERILLGGYQNVFYYIWQVKEMLNIQSDPEANTAGGDYRYPNFGYVYSEGEKQGRELRTTF